MPKRSRAPAAPVAADMQVALTNEAALIANVIAHMGPRGAAPPADNGVHAILQFTVIPDNGGMTLIAPNGLFRYGWQFHYAGSGEGSSIEVPGVRTFPLRMKAAHIGGQDRVLAYLDLVRTPQGNMTVYDPANPDHSSLRKYEFMMDSGAETSLIKVSDSDVFLRTDTFTGHSVSGVGGPVTSLGGGYIDFAFPGYRVKPMPVAPAAPAGSRKAFLCVVVRQALRGIEWSFGRHLVERRRTASLPLSSILAESALRNAGEGGRRRKSIEQQKIRGRTKAC